MARAFKLVSLQHPISNGGLTGAELPKRIKVLSWGRNDTLKGTVIVDHDTARIFNGNQKQIGRERAPIDYDHNTVKDTEAYKALQGRPPVIFGYGTPTVVPGDGIWFEDIQWTPDGEKQARNFIDLSPTPLLDENGRVLAIHSCALTPAGAVDGLSFYNSFASLETFAAETNMEYLPDAYKQTREWLNKMGLGTDHKVMKEHLDYFRQTLGLGTTMSDGDVQSHVMAAAMTAFAAKDGKEDKEMMKHLSAVFGHVKSNPDPNNPPHMNQFPSEGGPVYHQLNAAIEAALKPLQATITGLNAEISTLKTAQTAQVNAAEQAEKDALIAQAGRDKKIIPLSADTIKTLSVAVVREMVNSAKPAEVPTSRKNALRPLGADGKPQKLTMADAARIMEEQALASAPVRQMAI